MADQNFLELEFSEEEEEVPKRTQEPVITHSNSALGLKPAAKKEGEPKAMTLNGQLYAQRISELNAKYPEHHTLLPYSYSLIMEDIVSSRLLAAQIIARSDREEVTDFFLLVLRSEMANANDFELEEISFDKNRFNSVSKFCDLFFSHTLNHWDNRHSFLEVPGKYRLLNLGEFVLHNAVMPSSSEEAVAFIEKIKFVQKKLVFYQQFETSQANMPMDRFLKHETLSYLLKLLKLKEEVLVNLSNRKIEEYWRLVELMCDEFRLAKPRKQLLDEYVAEFYSAFYQNQSVPIRPVASLNELKDLAKQVQTVGDLYEYFNFVSNLYNYISSEEPIAKFVRELAFQAIKVSADESEGIFVESLFRNSFSKTHVESKRELDSVYKVSSNEYDAHFFPYKDLKKTYLWKAFDMISFPAFTANKCFFYADEPAKLSGFLGGGAYFYDCSSKAINNLLFPLSQNYFVVLFEVATGICQEICPIEEPPAPTGMFHSVKAKGRWQGEEKTNGKGITYYENLQFDKESANSIFVFNEYLIQDSFQYKPAYILLFK
jgi:hypothetical protein